MCKIIDFTKYKYEQEIKIYESSTDLRDAVFVCPDCRNSHFEIYLDLTAKCSECDLSVEFRVED